MSQTTRTARMVGLALAAIALLGACDRGWLQTDGGADRRRSNPGERQLTPANVAGLQQRYVFAAGTRPAVVGSTRIYVTDATTLYALDKQSGALLWSRSQTGYVGGSGPHVEADDAVRVSFQRPGGSLDDVEVVFSADGVATPVDDAGDDELLAVRGGQRLYKADVDSEIHRLRVTGTSFDGWVGRTGPPATLGPGSIYTIEASGSTAATVNAYDLRTPCPPPDEYMPSLCTPKWRLSVPRSSSSPVIGPDRNLYTSGELGLWGVSRVTSIDPRTGTIRWQVGSVQTNDVAVDQGSVYAAGRSAEEGESDALEVLDTADGSLKWRAELPSGSGPYDPGFAAVGGDVVYAAVGPNVSAYPADGCGEATCEALWTAPLPGAASGLAVTSGRLYVGTEAGLVVFGVPAP